MTKYTEPTAEIYTTLDTVVASSPVPDDNETPIIPWADWANP
jgi:hypothetical protein